jgi:hypothetical protein
LGPPTRGDCLQRNTDANVDAPLVGFIPEEDNPEIVPAIAGPQTGTAFASLHSDRKDQVSTATAVGDQPFAIKRRGFMQCQNCS